VDQLVRGNKTRCARHVLHQQPMIVIPGESGSARDDMNITEDGAVSSPAQLAIDRPFA
jgi:hypothetical protein